MPTGDDVPQLDDAAVCEWRPCPDSPPHGDDDHLPEGLRDDRHMWRFPNAFRGIVLTEDKTEAASVHRCPPCGLVRAVFHDADYQVTRVVYYSRLAE
jgi:hypothetical protein